MKLDILAIGVHPDDVELGCGGTILKQVDLGYKVGIVDLTKGELGSRGSITIRKTEATAAMKYAKVSARENLGMADGFFENNKANKLKLIKAIRKYQPDVVLANAISDRHPDHGRAAQLISEACYLSGLLKIKTKVSGKAQKHWRPRKVFHYIQDHHIEPQLVVDITGYLDKKMEMVQKFGSQFFNGKGAETPISSKSFLESVRAKAIVHGRRIGVDHGEGFTCKEYIGVEDVIKVL